MTEAELEEFLREKSQVQFFYSANPTERILKS